jgi:hypothetical protein
MGLPAAQNSVEGTASLMAEDTSAETNLAAAFEQAALAARVDPEPEKKSLFGFLKPKIEPTPAILAPAILAGTDIEVVDGASTSEEVAQTGAITTAENAPQSQGNDPILETTKPVKSGLGGVFGFLKPKAASDVTQAALKAPVLDTPQIPDEAVSVSPDDLTDAVPQVDAAPQTDAVIEPELAPDTTPLPKKPLFGFLKPKDGTLKVNRSKANKTAPQKSHSTVALGEVLPFGTVGISCEARPKDMGKQVDKFPSSGSASWQIFDTDPSSTAPRTQFITGFKDGCARQVTAALVLFGSPSLHEVHRYTKARSKVSWSKADNSYETIKSSVCSVGRKTPCPSGKLDRLEQQMAFVSVYKQFGDAKGWLELLLHNGKMETQELR